jgi:hypothetical protein
MVRGHDLKVTFSSRALRYQAGEGRQYEAYEKPTNETLQTTPSIIITRQDNPHIKSSRATPSRERRRRQKGKRPPYLVVIPLGLDAGKVPDLVPEFSDVVDGPAIELLVAIEDDVVIPGDAAYEGSQARGIRGRMRP